MPFRYILFSILLIAFNISNALPFLDNVEDECLVQLYRICESLDRISETEFLLIQKTNNTQKKFSISELMQQLKLNVPKEILLQKKPLDLFSDSSSYKTQAKAKMIKEPKVFFYSEEDGKCILKFECKSVTFFRKKVGPFEIPYNSHIITDPLIQLL